MDQSSLGLMQGHGNMRDKNRASHALPFDEIGWVRLSLAREPWTKRPGNTAKGFWARRSLHAVTRLMINDAQP